jgi:hypothetical protein
VGDCQLIAVEQAREERSGGGVLAGCGNSAEAEARRQSGDGIPMHQGSWYFACMSRLARMVIPGLPHHVTQRGNRREAIFFEDGDQQLYCDTLAEQLRKFSVGVWAYCLMPNHVHLILTPQGADGMSRR